MLIKKTSKYAIHILLDRDDFDKLHAEFNKGTDFSYSSIVELNKNKSLKKVVNFFFLEEINYIIVENSEMLRITLDDDHRIQFLDLIASAKKSGYFCNGELGECEIDGNIFSVYLAPYLSIA